jgi:bla regulator protein blaR1
MRTPTIVLVALFSAIAMPMAQDAEPHFEVVSVKENTSPDLSIRSEPQPPDGYRRTALPLSNHLAYAFDVPQLWRIVDLPDWARLTRYDITGKASAPVTEQQRRSMMRDVLISRFKLRTHTEQREQTVYVMSLARSDKRLGIGLKSRPDCADMPCASGGTGTPEGVKIQATTLSRFAEGLLSNLLRQMVMDESGIAGVFDIEATWRPATGPGDAADNRPDMFTALRDQLGLKLEPQKRSVEVLVIDHIERPTEN